MADVAGTPPPPSSAKSRKKWYILGGIALVAIAVAAGQANRKREADNRVENEDAVPVSAETLIRAYYENEAAANNKYKGKVLEITGEVKDVKEEYVRIKPPRWDGSGPLIHHTIDLIYDARDRDYAAKLSPGQVITTRGIFRDKGPFAINITNCKFLSK